MAARVEVETSTSYATGKSPYPVERTLLTTTALDFWMRSLAAGGKRMEDGSLEVSYQDRPVSLAGPFRRASLLELVQQATGRSDLSYDTHLDDLRSVCDVHRVAFDDSWGAGKLVPVGFGIRKLQINIVIEDDKVSVSDLEEEIQAIEEYVQSTDVAAMQKL
jgi:translation elongation factor EF-1beta